MEEAKIIKTPEAGALFVQGDLSFKVDPDSLERTLGAADRWEDGSVLDRLTDSSLVALAMANGLAVDPYRRDLLREPLHGVIQLAWYRDLKGYIPESCIRNQALRIAKYAEDLERAKSEPAEETGRSITYKAVRQYRLAPGTVINKFRGRKGVLLAEMKKLGPATIFQIVEAVKAPLKTKSDLERVVTFLVNDLAREGVLEIVGEQFKIK